MIHVLNFARQYAEEVGGQYTDYDQSKGVLVVPLPEGRFQTVLVMARPSPSSGNEIAIVTSKVCEVDSTINFRELLEKNINFDYAKYIIEDNYLKVEASCVASMATDGLIKEMILEVANHADQMEHQLTGADIH